MAIHEWPAALIEEKEATRARNKEEVGQGGKVYAPKEKDGIKRIKFLARHESDPGAEGIGEHNNELGRMRRRCKEENCDGEGVFL